MVEQIKRLMGITGDYHDEMIKYYIEEVEQYMIDGGVDKRIVDSPYSIGVIARGVIDIWNYGAGDGKLSPYFKERVIQLSMKEVE